MRESIDQLVYDAEEAMLVRHGDRRFDGIPGVRHYIDELVAQDWFRRRWPQRMSFTVRDGRGTKHAICWSVDGENFVVSLPRGYRTQFIVLHEIAHVCTWQYQDHGLMFREALLYMVRRRIGRDAAALLAREWRLAGLPVDS